MENELLKKQNAELKILKNRYFEQWKLAQQRRFGTSSEKTSIVSQLSLFNEAEIIASESKPQEVSAHKRKKSEVKREDFYDGLHTEQIIYELPADEQICPDCGGRLHACGYVVARREVEVIPAKIKAVEHVQTVYTCRNCDKKSYAAKANVSAPIIPGSGIVSPSLLSFIVCNKYVLALPLYRQEQELKRIGVHISRQTMANWIVHTARKYISKIYGLLHSELILNDILHACETAVQVIKETGRKASQKLYIRMYRTGRSTDRHVVLFEYQPTCGGGHPESFLEGFKGYLHVDGCSRCKELENNGVTLVECWQRVHSKFNDALKILNTEDHHNSPAYIGFEYCNKLFDLERKFDAEKLTNDRRKQIRILESKPVVDEFFAWAESMLPSVFPKSLLGTAVTYAVNQRELLNNFLLDGRLEITNNRAERSICPFTVGRKNWLFSFSAKDAESSAMMYSIIETAQENGLVPLMYLEYLLKTLPGIPVERYCEYLPWCPAVREVCEIPSPNSDAAEICFLGGSD